MRQVWCPSLRGSIKVDVLYSLEFVDFTKEFYPCGISEYVLICLMFDGL